MNTIDVKLLKRVGIMILYMPLIFLIILIALYPLQFFLVDGKVGILDMKSEALLTDKVWKTFFYLHIIFGGLALLVGWIQFNKFLRDRYRQFHRNIGKVYMISVWLSAFGVAYIGFFAEGGAIAFFGFMAGGFLWAYTTIQGYLKIRRKRVLEHQQVMIYSYAMCLGAVTLRLWLPLLNSITHDFILSYQLVSWISWIPNLTVAYFLAKQLEHTTTIENFTDNR